MPRPPPQSSREHLSAKPKLTLGRVRGRTGGLATRAIGTTMAYFCCRAVMCATSFMLAGCMQSTPSADAMTKPAVEAFTRLSAWRPWQPTPEPQAQPQLASVSTTPVAAPPEAPASTPPASPEPVRPTAAQSRLASALATPRVEPKRERRIAPPDQLKPLPASVSCQAVTQPGQRVRMECNPID